MQNLIKNILTDVKVELSTEFDQNFTRKAFFDKKWKDRKRQGKGTLLVVTGKLRRSIRAKRFFIWVCLCTIPGIILAGFLPIPKDFGKKK